MVFKRNKDYYAELKQEKKDFWVAQHPLFISGDKGLFPVFETDNRHGLFSKNHHGFVLKDMKKELKWDI